MSGSGENLSGLWHGRYGYDDGWQPPVAFTAELLDIAGGLSGLITETQAMTADAVWPLASPTLVGATIEGRRDGGDVSFLKTYDGTAGWRHAVAYAGLADSAFTEISGRWLVNGATGWFLMIRASSLPAARETAAVERL